MNNTAASPHQNPPSLPHQWRHTWQQLDRTQRFSLIGVITLAAVLPLILFVVVNPTRFFSQAASTARFPATPTVTPPPAGINWLRNGSFEEIGFDGMPKFWGGRINLDDSDTPVQEFAVNGQYSFKITGVAGMTKFLSQSTKVSVPAGEHVILGANAVSSGPEGVVFAELVPVYVSGEVGRFIVKIPVGQTLSNPSISGIFTMPEAVETVIVRVRVSNYDAEVYFDNVFVTGSLAPPIATPQPSTPAPGGIEPVQPNQFPGSVETLPTAPPPDPNATVEIVPEGGAQ